MKYKPIDQSIPQSKREELNAKVLAIVETTRLPDGITNDDLYNAYTGIGGLHGLNRNDYNNYYEFSKDKQEIEQGQFFTPGQVVESIVSILQIQDTDLICDPACGAGAFFNAIKEHQCHGCDIDLRAVKVAKFLYPEAHIDVKDLRYYEPEIKFDYVIGNPPFNLRWDYKDGMTYPSQQIYCMKAAEILKPGGFLVCIVPDNFLRDVFFNKSMVEVLDEQFNFLFQYQLSDKAFKPMGVEKYETKVICFQKKAASLEPRNYAPVYVTYRDAKAIMASVVEHKKELKAKLQAELVQSIDKTFEYKVKKYLYEIRVHKTLNPYLSDALAYLEKFKKQQKPDNMEWKEWDKIKITEPKVLAYLRRIIGKQNKTPKDVYKLVLYKYGIKYKPYSGKAQSLLTKVHKNNINFTYLDMLTNGETVKTGPLHLTMEGMTKGIRKLIYRKQHSAINQTMPFSQMQRDPAIDKFLNKFAFRNPKGHICRLNAIQKEDLGLIMQKEYGGILNWQQGSGKTAGATAWMAWKPQRNTFIIGPALAINTTWAKHMKVHEKPYVNIRSYEDVLKIRPGMFVLCGLEMLIKYERYIKKYIKLQSKKINLVFDESDEITNNTAKRTKVVLNCFRRVKRCLLTTGTTTRNNINEIYSQFELLYNNSINFICRCRDIWKQDKDGELYSETNSYYGLPFPPYFGPTIFRQCFNPAKSTVFGIQKHNQDLYNEAELRAILEYTIRTRKFKEIAGDKYYIKNETVQQNSAEEVVYGIIINELNTLLPEYFKSTGNSRKDTMLKIIRQLQLLIKATSIPQSFKQYVSMEPPNKAIKIAQIIEKHPGKIAVGCTSLEAVDWYISYLRKKFPGRPIFKVIGDVSFKGRDDIRKVFESTTNGILVCTQQSLKSSVNIPSCNKVIIESKQWNIPKMEQFYFRFIRYDSPNVCEVIFLSYQNTIELNLMALLMNKERLNDYIKTLEYKDHSEVYDEYDVDLGILDAILTKQTDDEGKVKIAWGKAQLVS